MSDEPMSRDDELRNAVFDLIGSASMLWTETPSGVFRDEKAQELGESFLIYLRTRHDRP